MARSPFLIVLFIVLVSVGAFADTAGLPRHALVIGNGGYERLAPLQNPPNDATDVSAALEGLGFDVTTVIDADFRRMVGAVRAFGDRVRDLPGVALFYYAGHAVEVGGTNYLIPTDSDIAAEDEVEFSAVAVDLVLNKLDTAQNPVNIVVLDACRNNPLPATGRSAETGRGLSVIEAPRGTLIVYATEPGNIAADGVGRNSPFTAALLEHLPTPGLDIELMLREVRRDVVAATGGTQTPWTNSSLTESVSLAGPAFAVTVDRAVGTVAVTTRDPGELYVDGTRVAQLSADEQVTLRSIPAGARNLQMRYAGTTEEYQIDLAEDELQAVSFTYEADPRFTLVVDPGIDGIQVLVDGRLVGETPLELDLPAGARQVRLVGAYISTVTGQVQGESREVVRYAPEVRQLGELSIRTSSPTVVEINGIAYTAAERAIRLPVGDYPVRARLPDDTEWTYEATARVEYGVSTWVIPGVLEYSTTYQLAQLQSDREAAEARHARIDLAGRRMRVAGLSSFGTAALGGGLATVAYFLGASAYGDYESAGTSAEIDAARARIDRAGRLFSVGISTAGFGALGGTLLMLFRPDTAQTERRIEQIDEQIRTLERRQ